jgi:tetratricopeptide (TPR) repeat protein
LIDSMRIVCPRVSKLFVFLLFFCFLAVSAGDAGAIDKKKPCWESATFLRLGMHYEAEFSARNCLKQHPTDPRIWILLTRALAYQKKFGEALKWATQLVRRYPDDLDNVALRIQILAWSGDLRRAWKEKSKIERVAHTDPDKSHLIADIAYWRKDYHEAVRWYDYILKRWPDSPRARLNRNRCLKALGHPVPEEALRPPPAAAPAKPAPAGNPHRAAPSAAPAPRPSGGTSVMKSVAGNRRSCFVYEGKWRRRKYRDAEHHARACIKSPGSHYKAWNTLLRLLVQQNRLQAALRDIDWAIKREPAVKFFRYWRIKLLMAAGRLDQAWEETPTIRRFARRDRAAAKLVAGLALDRKDYATAQELYVRLLRKWPNDRVGRYNLGRAYLAQGKKRAAKRAFARVCKKHRWEPACRRARQL